MDDRLLDATQSVTIVATAEGYDQPSSAIMEVTDHETLLLNIQSGVISEFAGNAATFATITRSNIDNLGQTLTVNASSNDTSEVQTATTIEFAANSATVNLALHAIDDKLLDGRQTVIISVNAAGYAVPAHSALLVDDHETLYIAVNGDGWLSPGDALFVINHLNADSVDDGEGEWFAPQLPPRSNHDSSQAYPDATTAPRAHAETVFQDIRHWPVTATTRVNLIRDIEQLPSELESLDTLIDLLATDISDQWYSN